MGAGECEGTDGGVMLSYSRHRERVMVSSPNHGTFGRSSPFGALRGDMSFVQYAVCVGE